MIESLLVQDSKSNTPIYVSHCICIYIYIYSSVGNGFEYRIEYSIISNSKFSNFTDIQKCRIPKSNYSKISNV